MREKPFALLGGIAWVALVAALGVLAVGVEFDREGRKTVEAARRVPGPFRGYALETLARDALAKGNGEQGLALARELVRRRPIPAESLALYTNALLATGKGADAGEPLMLAAQRGWRDRYVQRLMVLVGQQTGDWQSAAQRLVALWRQGDDGEETLGLTKAVLSHPEGLAAFFRQFSAGDRWSARFLAWAGEELSADAARSAAVAMMERGTPVDCARLAGGTYDLARAGHALGAAAAWDPVCGKGRAAAAGDFSFRDLSGPPGPLDWRFPDQPDLTADLVSDAGHTSLRYENAAPVRVVIAERFALLRPGGHAVRLNGGTDAGRLQLRISCFPASGGPFGLGNYELTSTSVSFAVPANCSSQRLDVVAARGSGDIQGLGID